MKRIIAIWRKLMGILHQISKKKLIAKISLSAGQYKCIIEEHTLFTSRFVTNIFSDNYDDIYPIMFDQLRMLYKHEIPHIKIKFM